MTDKLDIAQVRAYLTGLQARITEALNEIDPTPFVTDSSESLLAKNCRATASPKSWRADPSSNALVAGFRM